jgi:Dyp-type peroxidase family
MDLDDLQGLIARGYAQLKAASFVLLQITSAEQARSWLRSLSLTRASDRQPERALNLALTASGLARLGLDPDSLGQFSNEFTAGMTTPHRRRMFGDLEASAPERWAWGGPSTPPVDLMLLIFATDVAALTPRLATLSAGYAGVSEILRLDATIDLDGKEHFGFADGISQPTIAGLSSRMDLPSNTIQPGEIVLGYPNEYGRFTDRPLLDPAVDPGGVLPRDADGSGKADLARNGSYMVFRQLSQDVRGFWRYLDQAVGGDSRRRTWLAAKMVGRWPSGAPLTLAPDEDAPSIATANDFTYHHFDELGLNCPIGAHVRRAHPRDSLDPDPGTERSVSLDRRHRILRRGREYGPPVDDVLSATPADDPDRGLYFICLVANIARQFEFIQHTWLNNPKFGEHYDDPDPVVGYHPPGGANFSIPADPVRERYRDLPRFVTTRGGAYFLLPGLRAVRFLTGA